jgi:hypothetical protein
MSKTTAPPAPPPAVTPARYNAPRVTVVPVTTTISSEPANGRSRPGHYQRVLLDTTAGELRFYESTEHLEAWDAQWTAINDVPRETWRRWHPGTSFTGSGPHQWFQPVPAAICWTVDSGMAQLPYLDADAANALLRRLAPHAQDLLDGLYDVSGHPLPAGAVDGWTDRVIEARPAGCAELDWSAASAHAGRNIGRLCSRDPYTTDADPELADYEAIVASHPQVYRPELTQKADVALARECEFITRFLGGNGHWHEEITQTYGEKRIDGEGKSYTRLDVLGVRAWYLAARNIPLPARDFGTWDAEHGALAASGITALTSDDDLEAWAARQQDAASKIGQSLLGALDAGRAYRQQQREADWDRLASVGAEVQRRESELAALRVVRRGLVATATLWRTSDTEIGTQARMTRQGVHDIRTADRD